MSACAEAHKLIGVRYIRFPLMVIAFQSGDVHE